MFSKRVKNPKHMAFDIRDIEKWSKVNSKDIEESLRQSNKRIVQTILECIKHNIIIFTFNVSDFKITHFPQHMDSTVELLNNLTKSPLIHENKVKISVIGKWYDLPSKVVDAVKETIDQTADYDNHFLNLCINYDGKEEIVDSLRIILRSIQYEKITPDQLSKQLIKENIYSSYFIPPDIIIFKDSKTNGFMLWDSQNSLLHFTGTEWCDFDKKQFKKSLEFFKNNS